MSDAIELARFGENHLEGAYGLSRQAGWPHRREDWTMALALGRGIMALRNGAVVGTAVATLFGKGATISLVIVDAALRGHGLGRRLMDAAIAACGERDVRLIATQDGVPLYRKLGFHETHEIRQHQGIITHVGGVVPDGPAPCWAGESDLPGIAAADASALDLDREALLRLLARDARLAVLRHEDRMVGYGALRSFGRGEVAGPVIAADEASARTILRFLFAARAGDFMRVDTPAYPALGPWLAARGLAEADGGIAMCRPVRSGGRATGDASSTTHRSLLQIFALASQALG